MNTHLIPRLLALASLTLMPLVPLQPVSASVVEPGSGWGTGHGRAVTTLLDWQLIALEAIFVEGRIVLPPVPDPAPPPGPVPVPVGTLFLGYTALAVHEAVQESGHRGHASRSAAIATAAHDVLARYLPNTRPTLDAALTTTLASIPDSAAERRGIRIGREAAADLIVRRSDDGFGDPQYVYALDATRPGIWKPVTAPPAGGMLAPWMGHVDPLVLRHPVRVDGPPALSSREWVRDFKEVKKYGSATATAPGTAHRQAAAAFFYLNSVLATERALVAHLREHPVRLGRAARMFAVMNAAMADAVRTVWKLKLEVGFWRPAEAIVRAAEDGRDATVPDPTWVPFRASPPYSEYASGHAVIIGAIAETARRYLGNDVSLELVSVPVPAPGVTPPNRSYATLSALEHDAFMSRIWAGIHFRDAMQDGYYIAHSTVRRVDRALGSH